MIAINRTFFKRFIVILIGSLSFGACNDPKPRDRQQERNEARKEVLLDEKTKVKTGFNKVIKVVDGDTFWILNDNNKQEKVRLIGMDTPEVRRTGRKEIGYYGKEASDYVKTLISNKHVRLAYDVQLLDQYKRTLAYVYLEDGTFLNDLLVKEGYAKVATYPPNIKYVDLFIESERYARSHNLGLWNETVK